MYTDFGFPGQALDSELCFASHEGAPDGQADNGRCAGYNGEGRGQFKEEFLAIVAAGRASDRNQRGGGKQAESGVKQTQSAQQNLRARAQGVELAEPFFVFRGSRGSCSQVGIDDACTIDDACQAIACAESEDRGSVCKNRRGDDGGQYAEGIAGERHGLQKQELLRSAQTARFQA